MIWLSGWYYRRALTINASDVSEDVNNFAYLVYLDSSNFDFSKAKSDGSDIRFTDSAGNLLSFFREKHDSTNQVAIYHVKIPTVSSSTDTTIYLYYGNSSATDGSSDFQTVFGDSGLVAYYPFDGNANDLSGNYNGTWSGTEQYDTGILGQAAKFDGNSYTQQPYISSFNGNVQWTFICVFKVNDLSHVGEILWFGDNGTGGALSFNISGDISGYAVTRLVAGDIVNLTNNTTDWVFSTVVNTTNGVNFYKNGQLLHTDTSITVNLGNGATGDYFNFGSIRGDSTYGYGIFLLDQVRVYNTALSSTQASLLYKMESKTLFSFGNEQTPNNPLWFGTNF